MRFQLPAWILGLAWFQQAAAFNIHRNTEDLPGFCQNVPQKVQQTYFEIPRDLPTAKAILCSLGALVNELEDEEKTRPQRGLQKRDDGLGFGFGFGCSIDNDEGCGYRSL